MSHDGRRSGPCAPFFGPDDRHNTLLPHGTLGWHFLSNRPGNSEWVLSDSLAGWCLPGTEGPITAVGKDPRDVSSGPGTASPRTTGHVTSLPSFGGRTCQAE